MSLRHHRRSRSRIAERPTYLSRRSRSAGRRYNNRRRKSLASLSKSLSSRRKSPVKRRSPRRKNRTTCTGGRIRNPRTGRCDKAEDFTPVELVQFLRLLGLTPTADHAENARILRAAIKPDRFDDAIYTLTGMRRDPDSDIFERRGMSSLFPKQVITAAERVGEPRPAHLPPQPPTPPSLFSSQSPVAPPNPLVFNMYSPGKVDLDIYEDDYDYDDYDDDDYDEYDDYDMYDEFGYPRQNWRQKLSYLNPAPAQSVSPLSVFDASNASPSLPTPLQPTPSPTAVQLQQQNLANLFGFRQ